MSKGLQNSCLMKAIPWKKEALLYLCFVVFGIVSLSVFE